MPIDDSVADGVRRSRAVRLNKVSYILLQILGLALLFPVTAFAILQINGSIQQYPAHTGSDPLLLKITSSTFPWAVLALCAIVNGFFIILLSNAFNIKTMRIDKRDPENLGQAFTSLKDVAMISIKLLAFIILPSGGYLIFSFITKLEPPLLTFDFLFLVIVACGAYVMIKNKFNLSSIIKYMALKIKSVGFVYFILLFAYLLIWVEILL